jgi:hypothetical protein
MSEKWNFAIQTLRMGRIQRLLVVQTKFAGAPIARRIPSRAPTRNTISDTNGHGSESPVAAVSCIGEFAVEPFGAQARCTVYGS